MNWDDLRYVYALANETTLAGAGSQLGVSPSTVHRRLGKIEAKLGARLFNRDRTGYRVTSAGEEAIAVAGEIDGRVTSLNLKLAGAEIKPRGIVRITTTDTIVPILSKYLAEFKKQYPEIILELIVSPSFLNLSRRDADLAIRPTNDPPETLIGSRLGQITYSIYGARELVGKLDSQTVKNHKWIGFDDSLLHLLPSQWMSKLKPTPEIAMKSNSLMAILSATKHAVGLAILPDFLGSSDEHLIQVQQLPEWTNTDLWILTHAELRKRERVKFTKDFFSKKVRKDLRKLRLR